MAKANETTSTRLSQSTTKTRSKRTRTPDEYNGQERRSRVKTALNEMAALLPEDLTTSVQGHKVVIIENVTKYIKTLQEKLREKSAIRFTENLQQQKREMGDPTD